MKSILITGATDGIGLETAKMLATEGHTLYLHGRNPQKLTRAAEEVAMVKNSGPVKTLLADLSMMDDVVKLSEQVREQAQVLDVLINNAGVFNAKPDKTIDGFDIRFAVNTFAPWLLTNKLRDVLHPHSRVINVSSAAQAPVDLTAMAGEKTLSDSVAYAQSKLALTMWSRYQGLKPGNVSSLIAVNPKSLLGSKMVTQAYGVAGGDLGIGANILMRAAVSDEFVTATGQYFDNDIAQFADPHPDAMDDSKVAPVLEQIDRLMSPWL